MDAPQTKFDAEARARFVVAYAKTGEKKGAAAVAGVTPQTVYNRITSDPEFAAEVKRARGELLQEIVDKLRHCAIEGVKKTTFDKDGNKVAETYVYSAPLMLAWLKRLERDKWGDKVQVDQSVTVKDETKPADIPAGVRTKMREALRELRRVSPPSVN